MFIAINDFARRQTEDSPFSHFNGNDMDLIERVTKAVEDGKTKPGYRDGVTLVTVEPRGFFSGVVEVTPETELVSTFEPRREGEAPFIQTRARGPKLAAAAVEVVLYRHDVLGADASTEAEWEIISINARPTVEPEPMTPMAMARNMLGLEGGTDAEYTAEEICEAILYWSTRAMKAE